MPDLFTSEARGDTIRFLGPEGMVDVPVTKREWDVTDPEARAKAFREQVGEDVDEWWLRNAQWYISAERNAAALAVFLPKPELARG